MRLVAAVREEGQMMELANITTPVCLTQLEPDWTRR